MGHNVSPPLTAVYASAYTGSLGTVLEELPVASADAVVAATRHEPAGPQGAVCLRALARTGWRACAEFCAAGPRARRRSGAVSGAAQQVAIVNSLGPPVARKQTLATGRRGGFERPRSANIRTHWPKDGCHERTLVSKIEQGPERGARLERRQRRIIIDMPVHNKYPHAMVRPREFDRDEALDRATRAFWAKGYASTSIEDLLAAMNIGRQSLYNAFGDKRKLYLEALERYQRESTASHLERLNSSASPLGGIEALLFGIIAEDDRVRALGCMGVSSVCEFGAADPELVMLRSKAGPRRFRRLVERIRDVRAWRGVDHPNDYPEAAALLQMTMQGIQLGARPGGDAKRLGALARFAIDRFRPR